MKILILSKKTPYPVKDGENMATMQSVEGLWELGHELQVLTMNTHKHQFDYAGLPSAWAQKARFEAVYVHTEISLPAAFLNLWSRHAYHIRRFHSAAYARKLKEILTQNQFDLVQLEGPYLSQYLPDIRKHFQGPVVLRAHNVEHLIWERAAANQHGWKAWYLRMQARRLARFERETLNQHDALLPISPHDAGLLAKLGVHIPVQVFPAFIRTERYQPADPATKAPQSIFFVGSLDWLPNLHGLYRFLPVFRSLRKAVPGLSFHVAGRNTPAELLHLKEPGLFIHGEVQDAIAFMQQFQLMVVPLWEGSGVRLKIMEALALGIPVISTSIGAEGLGLLPDQEVLLADNEAALEQQLLRLLQDKSLQFRLGAAGRDYAIRHFDAEVIMRDLDIFYKELVAQKKKASGAGPVV